MKMFSQVAAWVCPELLKKLNSDQSKKLCQSLQMYNITIRRQTGNDLVLQGDLQTLAAAHSLLEKCWDDVSSKQPSPCKPQLNMVCNDEPVHIGDIVQLPAAVKLEVFDEVETSESPKLDDAGSQDDSISVVFPILSSVLSDPGQNFSDKNGNEKQMNRNTSAKQSHMKSVKPSLNFNSENTLVHDDFGIVLKQISSLQQHSVAQKCPQKCYDTNNSIVDIEHPANENLSLANVDKDSLLPAAKKIKLEEEETMQNRQICKITEVIDNNMNKIQPSKNTEMGKSVTVESSPSTERIKRRVSAPVSYKENFHSDDGVEDDRSSENESPPDNEWEDVSVDDPNSSQGDLMTDNEKDKQEKSASSSSKNSKKPGNPTGEVKHHSCKICAETFTSERALKRHRKTHKRVTVACDICNKMYANPGSLAAHKNLYHAPGEKHCCDICGRKFNKKANLLLHCKTHTVTKQFTCQPCGKTFRLRSDVYKHCKRVHGITHPKLPDEAKEPCPICNMETRNLDVHMSIAHPSIAHTKSQKESEELADTITGEVTEKDDADNGTDKEPSFVNDDEDDSQNYSKKKKVPTATLR